ncbi:MAG TPA: MFS transporter, partial [Gaiellaceae bacterium]
MPRFAWPRGGLWRDSDFLRFWAAQTASQVGSQVTQLALPLVAIVVLDASTFEVALLTVVEFLPWLIVSLPAGVWVDRVRRRPVLVAADVGRALALAWVPLGAALGVLSVWQLYAVGFVAGSLTVFFDVGYQSYIPSLVGRDRLVDGNSKLEFTRSAAQIGGPGLGGALITALSAPYAILVDAASFVVSALLLGTIR